MEVSSLHTALFDLGGTLVDPNEYSWAEMVRLASRVCPGHITKPRLEREIRAEWARRETDGARKQIKKVTTWREELDYWRGFFTCVLLRLGALRTPGRVVDALAEIQADPQAYACFPEVEQTLDELANCSIPLGVLSNAYPSAKGILSSKELKGRFQYLFLSYEMGSIKPEPEIYRKVIHETGVKPWEILFVDDRASFVKGARETLMHALLLKRSIHGREAGDKLNKYAPRSGGHLVGVIQSLREIPESILTATSRQLYPPQTHCDLVAV